MSLAPSSESLLETLRDALSGDYVVHELIGVGGMGSVFRARDRKLDRFVAIKVVPIDQHSSEVTRRRFLEETRILARLRHPNIVTLYTAGEAPGLLYFVMDLVPGESLRDRLKREGRCDPAEARRIITEIGEALAYAHEHGVIHRDIKPENVLLDAELGRAMLTDFGIARAIADEERLTRVGSTIGSPQYMSPEQALGQDSIDGRSDLYSLGIVGYEILAGAPPFTGDARSVMAQQVTGRASALQTLVPEAPVGLTSVIERALEKEPSARWQSAADMVQALRPETMAVGAPPNRRPAVALLAAVALLLAIPAAWIALQSDGGDNRRSFFIAPFEVQGNDPSLAWLREASMNMLGLNLSSWSDLRVVPYDRAVDLLREARIGENEPIGLATARALARKAGAGTIVTGQVMQVRDSLSVVARVYDVGKDEPRKIETVSAAMGADPRTIFDQLARKLLDLMGAPPMTPELARITTTSLAAYQAYVRGLHLLNRMRTREADTAFAQAIAADSTFALAYYKRALSRSWGRPPDTEPRVNDSTTVSLMGLASLHASRLPYREQELIAGYNAFVLAMQSQRLGRGPDAEPLFTEAIGHLRRVIDRDSTDAEAWFLLGDAYVHNIPPGGPNSLRRMRGQAERWTAALRALSQAIRFDSSFHLSYTHRHDIYATATNDESAFLLLGDSLVFLPDTANAAISADRIEQARRITRAAAIRDARQWTFIEPALNSHHTLVSALVAANQFDSAAIALREAIRRPTVARPYMRFWLAGIQLGAGDTNALSTLRSALGMYPPDSLRRDGPRHLSAGLAAAYNVALAHGALRDLERVQSNADSLAIFGPNTPLFVRAAPYVDLAGLGIDTPEVRRRVQTFIDAVDQFRSRNGNAGPGLARLTIAFLGLRDTAYLAVLRRWGGGNVEPELQALAALDRGDTVRAARLAQGFASEPARRTGADRPRLMTMSTFARAEVYAAIGDPRRALEELDRIDTKSFQLDAGPDARWAIYPRTFLLRGAIYEGMGERDKALKAYRDFLFIWRAADPALEPQLKLAREAVRRLSDAPARR